MNNCIFIGRLTKDPEIRYTQKQEAVANFTIAVDRRFQKDKTDFFAITAWGKTAEFAEKYFRKGMRIAAQGEMQTEKYTDRNNIERIAYKLVASNLEFADGKQEAAPGNAPADGFMDAADMDGLPFE